MDDRYAARDLDADECWALVSATVVGRVAFVLGGRPRIFPVTYGRDGSSVVFRTAEGSELAQTANQDVAFEIDGYVAEDREAWSVIIAGPALVMDSAADLERLSSLALFPWHSGPKGRFLRIEARTVTGRRFVTPYAGPAGFGRGDA